MAQKTQYVCENCGAELLKWEGRCPQCHTWNSLKEEALPSASSALPLRSALKGPPPMPFSRMLAAPEERFSCGLQEMDRVLGGGLAKGAFLLLGGSPGVGKSTLLLQMSNALALSGKKTLYISGEESGLQTALRAKRIGARSERLFFSAAGALEEIMAHALQIQPKTLIIDSIQTIFLQNLPQAPGSAVQIRECSARLMTFAKTNNITVFIIGHVTKDGSLAGPKLLEHLVDVVLSFEGEDGFPFRILRSYKNRFGPAGESAVFKMGGKGLQEAPNPSELFLRDMGSEPAMGSAVFSALEGRRPLLCEVQSLTVPSYMPAPRRTSLGLDLNRIHMICAVLDKYLNTEMGRRDLFVSLTGGLKIPEPAADLAIAASVLSSRYKKPLPLKSCFFGELGLTGALRASPLSKERLEEADKLGFQSAFLPANTDLKGLRLKNLKIHKTRSLEGLRSLFPVS